MLVFREAALPRGPTPLNDGENRGSALPRGHHPAILRVSMPTPIGWLYFNIQVGRERRSLDRLAGEGQFSLAKLSLFYTLAMWVIIGLIGLGVMVGVYMLKSMAGINLMRGASFLHNFFYASTVT